MKERAVVPNGSTVLSGRGKTLETAVDVTYVLEDTVLLCVCVNEKQKLYNSSLGLTPSGEVCCASRGKPCKRPIELMTRELGTLNAVTIL